MIIAEIVSQHVEESAFLWLLRSNAIHQPHYGLKALAKLDNRVEAHLDGLRVAGGFHDAGLSRGVANLIGCHSVVVR